MISCDESALCTVTQCTGATECCTLTAFSVTSIKQPLDRQQKSPNFNEQMCKLLHRFPINKYLLIYVVISLVFNPTVWCLKASAEQSQNTIKITEAHSVITATNSIEYQNLNYSNDSEHKNYPKDDDEYEIVNDEYVKPSDQETVLREYQKQYLQQATINPIYHPIIQPNWPIYQSNSNHKSIELSSKEQLSLSSSTSSSSSSSSSSSQCASCQNNDELKKASLESIKRHVLMKLGMEHEPNITRFPSVPKNILQVFCKSYGRQAVNGCESSKYENEYVSEYQADAARNEQDDNVTPLISNEDEDEYFPITNRIYAFPNRKFTISFSLWIFPLLKTK